MAFSVIRTKIKEPALLPPLGELCRLRVLRLVLYYLFCCLLPKNSIMDGYCSMRSLIDWVISTEFSSDLYSSVLYTIINKAAADEEDCEALISTCASGKRYQVAPPEVIVQRVMAIPGVADVY